MRVLLTLISLLGSGLCHAQQYRCDGLQDLQQIGAQELIEELGLETAAEGFLTGSPYPETGDRTVVVNAWWESRNRIQPVCGVVLVGQTFRLKNYWNIGFANDDGAIITHAQHCGTCSGLQDLSVYISTPDLTTPVRRCAREASLLATRDCLVELGFTIPCAETWAYNAHHTRETCARTCRKYYGTLSVLTGRMGKPNNLRDGSLNPCLACDEEHSGPGFQYAAGRTRRGSGLQSAIQREEGELFEVDHSALPGCQAQP
jgi:hypothetical protein